MDIGGSIADRRGVASLKFPRRTDFPLWAGAGDIFLNQDQTAKKHFEKKENICCNNYRLDGILSREEIHP
jgi:hypothetical protein